VPTNVNARWAASRSEPHRVAAGGLRHREGIIDRDPARIMHGQCRESLHRRRARQQQHLPDPIARSDPDCHQLLRGQRPVRQHQHLAAGHPTDRGKQSVAPIGWSQRNTVAPSDSKQFHHASPAVTARMPRSVPSDTTRSATGAK